jgi:hypothetical protein
MLDAKLGRVGSERGNEHGSAWGAKVGGKSTGTRSTVAVGGILELRLSILKLVSENTSLGSLMLLRNARQADAQHF